jgi:hypothetical protein
MGFLKKLASLLGSGEGKDSKDDKDIHREYVRCARCGEKITVRVDLRHELTPQLDEGEGAYYVRKGVLGSGQNRCFQMVEVELYFDPNRQFLSRYVTGGAFITREEFLTEEKQID